jgi:hypothetical protein
MFYNMIKPSDDETGDSDSEGEQQSKGFKIIEEAKKEQFKQTKLSEKGQQIRNKIKFVSKMLKMQKVLR